MLKIAKEPAVPRRTGAGPMPSWAELRFALPGADAGEWRPDGASVAHAARISAEQTLSADAKRMWWGLWSGDLVICVTNM